jgi:hypothetical protein
MTSSKAGASVTNAEAAGSATATPIPAASNAAVPFMLTATAGAAARMQRRRIEHLPGTISAAALHPFGALSRRAMWTFHHAITT